MKNLSSILILSAAVLALSACSGAKEQLGLTRQAPDEFAVVKRAPLEMPPDYTLRPPTPGANRPQESAVGEQAREVVFGRETADQKPASTSAESFILQQTGGAAADPSIRQTVDHETAVLEPANKPVAEKLLGWTGVVGGGKGDEAAASVVDAPAEAARLRQNVEEGKPVTEGETPSKQQ